MSKKSKHEKSSKSEIALAADPKDHARVIFGNVLSDEDYKKACKGKQANISRYGDDSDTVYRLKAEEAPVVGSRLGIRKLSLSEEDVPFDIWQDALSAPAAPRTSKYVEEAAGKPVVVGNIRMGFGHYRIAIAMASAARAMGYVPYWFDLCGFEGTTCSKLVQGQNKLYSMGSRLSQKVKAFDRLYWEPLNSEGFRQLTYNAGDQKNAELMAPVYQDLPKDVPFVATHAWAAQGAIHAGLTSVVNAIPDNWPMALHLAEGSLHVVQTPSAYLGYKMLRGMASSNLRPMPSGSLMEVGHYIDHEIVSNIPEDCSRRLQRASNGEPVRYLICVGGAGAQQDYIRDIIKYLMRYVVAEEATILINVGDHAKVWKALKKSIPELEGATEHKNNFDEVEAFCNAGMDAPVTGVHAFTDKEIFGAVYSTNLLMRICDVLVTKPSELAFYPVPKLMIHRVGGHEAWGAIRAAELGDGTYELESAEDVCAAIDVIQEDRSIIATMSEHIVSANEQGVYNGAYKAVSLAAAMSR